MANRLVWEKLGQIFPTRGNKSSFGQVPFAVVHEDRVRVYFSSRGELDEHGQYVSFGAYVDICPRSIGGLNVDASPATMFLQAGTCGEFDEYGVMPGSLARLGDQTLLFYCGWARPNNRPYRWRIGVLQRDQSQSPASQACQEVRLSRDSELVACPIVFSTPEGLRMYFLRGDWIRETVDSAKPESTYLLHAATSINGVDWEVDEAPLVAPVVEFEAQTSATVLKDDDGYHLLFSFRNGTDFRDKAGRGYRLGYAFSQDGVLWDRRDECAGLTTSAQGWDSEMVCYPSAFVWQQDVYLLYSGNRFGQSGFGLARLIGGLKGTVSVVTTSNASSTPDSAW